MSVIKEGYVRQVIERYENDAGMLIPMMQDLQAEYGYLPPEELRLLSRELRVPLTRVYGAAMFYSSFRLFPRGQHEVTLCMGTVCYLKGAPKISEAICEEYGIKPGGTTADRLFTLQAVNCVGACALAPVMVVDGKYYDGVTPDSALKILRGFSGAAEDAGASEPVAEPASEPVAESMSRPVAGPVARANEPAPPNPPSTAARHSADSAPAPAADAAVEPKAKGSSGAEPIGKARKTSRRKKPGTAKPAAKGKSAPPSTASARPADSTPRKSPAKPPAPRKPPTRKRSRP